MEQSSASPDHQRREQAFGLRINYYQGNDGVMFFAPDADPVIPAALAGKVLAIGGLDDHLRFRSHLKVIRRWRRLTQ